MLITEKEWHEKRKNGIGGSDCSSILGLNPYMTNVELWKYKTGKKEQPDISSNKNVIFGKNHEVILVEQFFEENKDKYEVLYKGLPIEEYLSKFPSGNASASVNDLVDMRFSDKNDFMFASLDGELVDKDTGEHGALEIKTCQINMYNSTKWKDGKIPNNYYCQVLHYLSVTNYSFAIVYAMLRYYDGCEEYKEFLIKHDEKKTEIKYLESAEADFWNNYVLKDIEPELLINI